MMEALAITVIIVFVVGMSGWIFRDVLVEQRDHREEHMANNITPDMLIQLAAKLESVRDGLTASGVENVDTETTITNGAVTVKVPVKYRNGEATVALSDYIRP